MLKLCLAIGVAAALAFAPLAASAQQPAPAPAVQQSAPAPAVSAPENAPAPAPIATETEAPAASSAAAPGAALPHDLSPWTMFLAADVLVKAIMIGLAMASVITWTILIAKSLELWFAKRRLRAAMKRLDGARTLAEAQVALGSTRNVLSSLLHAALNEIRLSADSYAEAGVKERAASSFAEILRAESRDMRRGMGTLATIGATSPFVGLLGTVWGIMNSFIGISKSQTTNLAVVAPGIAEALLATAIGLAAAIPAVVIYNHFSRATRGYLDLAGRAAGLIERLLSRDLDRLHGRVLARAAE